MSGEDLSFLEIWDLVKKIEKLLDAINSMYTEEAQGVFWFFSFSNKSPLILAEKDLYNFYQRLISSTGVRQ